VIAGGKFKPDQVRQQEVVSLLLDDAEVEENRTNANANASASTHISCY